MARKAAPSLSSALSFIELHMRKTIQRLFKILEFFPWIGPRLKIIRIFKRITYLFDSEQIEEARILRNEAFKKLNSRLYGPLYQSMGEDELYYKKDYNSAFVAFEKAISAYKKYPFLMGALSPDRLYGGAAQAALQIGEKDKALEYYNTFSDLVKAVSEEPSHRKYLDWHKRTLRLLEQNLKSKDNKANSADAKSRGC